MEAIEPYIRDEELPPSSVLVVRGGPITVEKLLGEGGESRRSTPGGVALWRASRPRQSSESGHWSGC